MVVETVVGCINRYKESAYGHEHAQSTILPVTACREWHSLRCTQPVSDPTRHMAKMRPSQSVFELFSTEMDLFPLNGKSEGSEMDKKIRKEYIDLFRELEGLPPHRPRFGDFRIRLLPGSKAPYRASYRLTPAEWEEYKRQIKLYEEKGHIRRSRSPYAAPVLFVPKPGGNPVELRMVIDYRALNAITIKDRFPLPLPEELIDKLQGKRFFSKMDF